MATMDIVHLFGMDFVFDRNGCACVGGNDGPDPIVMLFVSEDRMYQTMWASWRCVLMLTVLFVVGGCGYNKSTEPFMKPYLAGQFELAAQKADEVVGPVTVEQTLNAGKSIKVPGEDAIIFRLEQGAIQRTAMRHVDSTLALHHALEMIQQQDEQADFRIGQEAVAMFTNQAFRDYAVTAYDRLTLNLYLALNYMIKGETDNARTALRAMQQAQVVAEEHYRKRIEKMQDKAAEKNQQPPSSQQPRADHQRTLNDPVVLAKLQEKYGADAPLVADRAAYRPFSNPFGEYLMGLFFMTQAVDGSDAETAVTAFKRVQGMLPGNAQVAADLALAEQVASGGSITPTTYVFFETGLGPMRDEFRIDLPIFLVNIAIRENTGVNYVGAAFPYLKYRERFVPYLSVTAEGSEHRTELFTNMDEVVKTDFENELPLIITRTIISTLAKAAAAWGIHKATEGDVWVNLAANVVTTAYQIGMNQADLRTWQTLPKQFQAARMATPQDRILLLSLSGEATAIPPITLQEGVVNVVYVKSVQPGLPVVVEQFVLK